MTDFHIGIGNPNQLRREVLESLKSVVNCLKRYDQFVELHREREERVLELRKQLKEVSILINRATNELPKSQPLKPEPKIPAKKKGKKSKRSKSDEDEKSERTEKRLKDVDKLKKLARRIAEIEKDLKGGRQ